MPHASPVSRRLNQVASGAPMVRATRGDWIARLADHPPRITPTGCWLINENGRYGHVSAGGRMERIHRLVYTELVGPIPHGHVVHHHCEQPACINPAHLEAMTAADHRRWHASRRRTA